MIRYEKIALRFFFILVAILVFTFFDWIFHSSSVYLTVPFWYYKNKIIYGTLWAFLSSIIFRNLKIKKQAFVISIITIFLLQIRYIAYGYPLLFHLIVVIEHFFFLYMTTFFSLKLGEKLKLNSNFFK